MSKKKKKPTATLFTQAEALVQLPVPPPLLVVVVVVVSEVVVVVVVVVWEVVVVVVPEPPPDVLIRFLIAASYLLFMYACDASHSITPPKEEYCFLVATAILPRVLTST